MTPSWCKARGRSTSVTRCGADDVAEQRNYAPRPYHERQMRRCTGTHRGMDRTTGRKGTKMRPRVSSIITAHTSASALPDDEKGFTWYQNVYSHNHACPGYRPVSFIIPHWLPSRCWSWASDAR